MITAGKNKLYINYIFVIHNKSPDICRGCYYSIVLSDFHRLAKLPFGLTLSDQILNVYLIFIVHHSFK